MSSNDADVGMRCIKYMLFTTNFMFAMIGFLLISVGSTITAIYGDFELFMENFFFSPAALLVAIGVIIFFVSLFGCMGAIRQSTMLVNIYALLLAIILILEISATIAAYAMRGDINMYVEENMKKSLNEYNETHDEYIMDSWNVIQYRLDCCGIKGTADWGNDVNDVPDICKVDGDVDMYRDGCLNKLSYIVSECASLVGTGGICVAIVQFLGVIFAAMLAKSIRRLKTEIEIQRQENQKFYAQLANAKSEKTTPVMYTPAGIDA